MSEHRTYGETKNCKGCRYWSEMMAHCYGAGEIQAVCLAPPQPGARPYGQFVSAGNTCGQWASGHLGAIDEPGSDPSRYETQVESEGGDA